MSFQKCPICNGTGLGPANGINTSTMCTVCNGKKIINELTGNPPTNHTVEYPPIPKDCFAGLGPEDLPFGLKRGKIIKYK